MTAYMTLYLFIRDAITNGYGAKLPSKRQTAEAQGVSLITVAHAYDLLVEEGYVEPRERSGYFVVFREMDNYGAADPRPMSRSMDIARTKTEQREAGESQEAGQGKPLGLLRVWGFSLFPSLRARCAAYFPRMEKRSWILRRTMAAKSCGVRLPPISPEAAICESPPSRS